MNKFLVPFTISIFYTFFTGNLIFKNFDNENISHNLKKVSNKIYSKDNMTIDNYCKINIIGNDQLHTFNGVPLIISSVNFAGIANIQDPSNAGGSSQQYFLDQEASVLIGHSYELKLKGNYSGEFINNFIAYIDWNGNGVLTDEGEKYKIRAPHFADAVANIQVPSNALPGKTRIRIVRLSNNAPDNDIDFYACNHVIFETYMFQDYTINIIPSNGNLSVKNNKIDKNSISVHPDSVGDYLYIKSQEKVHFVHIYDMLGRIIFSSQVGIDQKINISSLNAGVYNVGLKTKSKNVIIKFIKQ